MRCPHCNAHISDKYNYCYKCGTIFNTYEKSSHHRSSHRHNDEPDGGYTAAYVNNDISVMSSVISHFSPMQGKYDEYDHVCERLSYYEKGASSALLIWGAIIFSIGIVMLGAAFLMPFMFILSFFFILPGLGMFIGGLAIKANNANKCNQYAIEYARLAVELINHYRRFRSCPVPAEYSNPRILNAIFYTLQRNNYSTIGDCVNYVISSVDQNKLYRYNDSIGRYTAGVNSEYNINVIFMPDYMF